MKIDAFSLKDFESIVKDNSLESKEKVESEEVAQKLMSKIKIENLCK